MIGVILRRPITAPPASRGETSGTAPATVDLWAHPPDPRLIDAVGGARCIRGGFVPWRRIGGATLVATAAAWNDEDAPCPALAPYRVVRARRADIADAVAAIRGRDLARAAETLVPRHLSARTSRIGAATLGLLIGTALCVAALGPIGVLLSLTGLAILTLILSSVLRLAAAFAWARGGETRSAPAPPSLPVISILIPLYDEPHILPALIERLSRLDYPPDRLDVLLVVEADDRITRRALARHPLPHWARALPVPDGPVRTKPRALNYALPFARGGIVGVWDAEDAPAPDQLRRVAARFAAASPEVVCLQGVLDFYNARMNWLSRCFAIEYASWFRVILPGLERLGLAVPLGGTTIFLRRGALEALGGWDAHNVTEDADLGIRIARAGWRTELIPTVTMEEANCAVRPWIVQRSRWLKGYAVTWAVHMRHPRALLRDLGAWRFMGVQILFGCTLCQFLLAPLMLSFWLIALGLPHPLDPHLREGARPILVALFVCSEGVLVLVSALGIWRRGGRALLLWIPVLHVYFPLAAIAAWRGVLEIATRPFFWHKTAHGRFSEPLAEASAGP